MLVHKMATRPVLEASARRTTMESAGRGPAEGSTKGSAPVSGGGGGSEGGDGGGRGEGDDGGGCRCSWYRDATLNIDAPKECMDDRTSAEEVGWPVTSQGRGRDS